MKASMSKEFDFEQAKDYLANQEQNRLELLETERKRTFKSAVDVLKNYFKNSSVQVYLIGSVTQPGKFSENSDVDIVLKNFTGDRFDIWGDIERSINRKIEIILYENSSFKDHIDQTGFKVL